jgi:hypothetical protein
MITTRNQELQHPDGRVRSSDIEDGMGSDVPKNAIRPLRTSCVRFSISKCVVMLYFFFCTEFSNNNITLHDGSLRLAP